MEKKTEKVIEFCESGKKWELWSRTGVGFVNTLDLQKFNQTSSASRKDGISFSYLNGQRPNLINEKKTLTRMHSSRMRTGRTLTVFRWRDPPSPKIWRNPPPKIWRTPPKIWRNPPPKIWRNPPPKIWRNPPWKFGGTPPPPLWTESHTPVKILPWPKLRFGR